MRPIDADILRERLQDLAYDDWNQGIIKSFADACNEIIEIVEEQPTVNAEPVIKCMDCKHYDGYYCHNEWWGDGYGNYTPPIKSEDGFCDWAERKEE